MKKCPKCGGEARRSHKHGFLQTRILKPLGIRPFRCRDCGAGFYRFSRNGVEGNASQRVDAQLFQKEQNGNGHFKELISQISEKEHELGLVKVQHGMADELRRLGERAAAEGLARATSEPKAAAVKPRTTDQLGAQDASVRVQ